MTINRRETAERAMLAAIDLREKYGRSDDGPIDVFALCDDMGVTVRFVPIPSMEGLYGRRADGTSVILLPSGRPLPRRVYSCAHELGHHLFGHGSSIDQMIGAYTDRKGDAADPREFLVDAFAGFLLMPTLGVRHGFASRGWKVGSASPEQVFTVSCSFGVGYETLITHMAYSLRMLSRDHANMLRSSSPKDIREKLLGRSDASPLVIVDQHWLMPTVDVELGTLLLLPSGCHLDGRGLISESESGSGHLCRARATGVFRVSMPGSAFAVFVRIAKKEFVGLAQFRHLETGEDDDDE